MGLLTIDDADQLLSYNTRQQVNIIDRNLGITYYLIIILVFVYTVFFSIIHTGGYFDTEASRGITVTHGAGDVYAHSTGRQGSRYFAPEEITYPGLENGNVFVATKVQIHQQTRGLCEDKSMKCRADTDCSVAIESACTDNGYCLEPSWCENDLVQPELYELPTSTFLLWAKSAIQFIQLNEDKLFHSNMAEPILYPNEGYNTFRLRDLLERCEPLPVRYEEISELGAIIEVQLIYNCNTDHDTCEPDLKVRRLDNVFDASGIGFGFKKAFYTSDGNTRELWKMNGVRVYFRTVGNGRKFSWNAIILKLSTGIALLAIGNIVTDWLMLNAFRLSKKYFSRKYCESEDFSEHFKDMAEQEKHLQWKDTAGSECGASTADEEDMEWQQRIMEVED